MVSDVVRNIIKDIRIFMVNTGMTNIHAGNKLLAKIPQVLCL